MIEVAPLLWVGTQYDYEDRRWAAAEWSVVQACKDPYHRKALGYKGRSPDAKHPEFFMCVRDNRLILNMVDAPDPKYVDGNTVDTTLRFIAEGRAAGRKVFVHCNQGRSRSPTLAMLALAAEMPESFEDAETEMRSRYQPYDPGAGVRTFARDHWQHYRKGV